MDQQLRQGAHLLPSSQLPQGQAHSCTFAGRKRYLLVKKFPPKCNLVKQQQGCSLFKVIQGLTEAELCLGVLGNPGHMTSLWCAPYGWMVMLCKMIIRNSPSVSLATSTAHCHLLVALLRDMALGDKSLEFNLSVPLWWSVASSLDIDSGKQSRYTNPIPYPGRYKEKQTLTQTCGFTTPSCPWVHWQ